MFDFLSPTRRVTGTYELLAPPPEAAGQGLKAREVVKLDSPISFGAVSVDSVAINRATLVNGVMVSGQRVTVEFVPKKPMLLGAETYATNIWKLKS